MSLTVPDQGSSRTTVIQFNMTFLTRKYITGEYRRVSFKTKEYHVKLEEIMSSKQPVTSDNLFWKRVIQEVHNKSMQQLIFEQKYPRTHERDERPYVTMKKNWMPTMTWKEKCPDFACCT